MQSDSTLNQQQQQQHMVKIEKNHTKLISGIPQQYLNNKMLQQSIQILPSHYNFQIFKTIYRIDCIKKQLQKQHLNISLQFPEGLMLFSCIISDIIRMFTNCKTMILGDIAYGACCVDDIASDQLDCDLLVHYGHSCLVPVTETKRKVMYVFVEIRVDVKHFVETVAYNFSDKDQRYYLLSTIQFNSSLFQAKQQLMEKGYINIIIPQEKPRSSGEVLGCTSPKLPNHGVGNNIVIFLCDGRFHMQAVMIANPHYQFYQYDPYTKVITQQKYDNELMLKRRMEQIEKCTSGKLRKICFILGTLGRQGNPLILTRLLQKIKDRFEYMILLTSQINSQILAIIDVDFFVQIACPRLSIDWQYGGNHPLLTPFELYALVDKMDIRNGYAMDYYSLNGGQWSNFYGKVEGKKKRGEGKVGGKQCPKVSLKIEDEK